MKCSKCEKEFDDKLKKKWSRWCPDCRKPLYNPIKRKQKYQLHRDQELQQCHKYYQENKDKYHQQNKIKHQILKQNILSHYSKGKICCKKCGKTNINILSIDHIKGGGIKHTKEICGSVRGGGVYLYRWLLKNNYPKGFQVLCMNCQFIKRQEKGECGKITIIKDKVYRDKRKLNIISHYSNGTCKCAICGETDMRCLSLDHINNDGTEHRKIMGGSGRYTYDYLKKNNYPNDPPLQVLCINCNFEKELTK